MYVITVTFQVKPAHVPEFLREIRINAANSLRLEPGCRHFDVCVSPRDARTVFLYELYDDRAAFDAHLASDHFQAFNRLTADWIESKEVLDFAKS